MRHQATTSTSSSSSGGRRARPNAMERSLADAYTSSTIASLRVMEEMVAHQLTQALDYYSQMIVEYIMSVHAEVEAVAVRLDQLSPPPPRPPTPFSPHPLKRRKKAKVNGGPPQAEQAGAPSPPESTDLNLPLKKRKKKRPSPPPSDENALSEDTVKSIIALKKTEATAELARLGTPPADEEGGQPPRSKSRVVQQEPENCDRSMPDFEDGTQEFPNDDDDDGGEEDEAECGGGMIQG